MHKVFYIKLQNDEGSKVKFVDNQSPSRTSRWKVDESSI